MKRYLLLLSTVPFMISCNSQTKKNTTKTDTTINDTTTNALNLPVPDTSASKTKFSKVIGWPADKTPVAPAGFTVTRFAGNIKSPRNIYVAPNGDILVVLSNSERNTKEKIANALSGKDKAEVSGSSANTVLLFRDYQ